MKIKIFEEYYQAVIFAILNDIKPFRLDQQPHIYTSKNWMLFDRKHDRYITTNGK